MKKLLRAVVVVVMLLMVAAPVSAHRPGDPPGWSHVNPGQGGTLPGPR